MKRKRKSRADIAYAIKNRIKTLEGVDDSLYCHISSIIDEEMNLKNKSIIKDNNGNTLYYCYRTEQYYPIENMVTFKNGNSRGYSRVSQLALAKVNAMINNIKKELTKALTNALTAEDLNIVENLKNEIKALEQAKKDKSIYRELNYYLNINNTKKDDNETK